MTMLAQLQVSGDLAGLARDFLLREGDTRCDLYAYLQGFAADSRISFSQWWELLDRLQQRYPQRHIGLELGQLVRPEFVGVLGYLLLSSETVADALQGFQRYQRLLHDGDRATASLQDGCLRLSWTADYGPSSRLSDEVLVVGMLTFIRQITGRPGLSPQAVHFSFAEPADTKPYRQTLGCEVLFQQAQTAILIRPEYLALPVNNHNAGLKQLLEQQAQALMDVLPQSESFVQSLRTALLKALQGGEPTSRTVARLLHLSERTLFRRLEEHQLAFKEVLAQTRMQLAKEYLSEGRLTHSEIALLLGYSEQSAFSRAFKRESGLSPRHWLCQR